MQRDPLDYVDSSDAYQYVVANPLLYNDPFGLITCVQAIKHFLRAARVAQNHCRRARHAKDHYDACCQTYGGRFTGGGLCNPLCRKKYNYKNLTKQGCTQQSEHAAGAALGVLSACANLVKTVKGINKLPKKNITDIMKYLKKLLKLLDESDDLIDYPWDLPNNGVKPWLPPDDCDL